jgi:hypothetical protein
MLFQTNPAASRSVSFLGGHGKAAVIKQIGGQADGRADHLS